VYSDYLQDGIRFPVFQMANNEMLYFDEVSVPCESELIISLQNEVEENENYQV
jgi:hypothetical protein